MRLCPSICPSVRLSVGPPVGPDVSCYFLRWKERILSASFVVFPALFTNQREREGLCRTKQLGHRGRVDEEGRWEGLYDAEVKEGRWEGLYDAEVKPFILKL